MARRWQRLLMTEGAMIELPGNRREPVKLSNLSAGGARIQTSMNLRSNERLMLHLPLTAGTRRTLPAHVVYCQRDNHGLHFFSGLSFVGAQPDGIPEVLTFIEAEKQRRLGTTTPWSR